MMRSPWFVLPTFAAGLALAAVCAVSVTGCGQRGSSSSAGPAPPAPTSTGTGASAGAGSACTSPAIEDPPECKLARGVVGSPSFAPDGRTVLVSVVRTGAEGSSAEVWDARAGSLQKVLVKGLESRGGLEAAWTADGSRVAVIGVTDSHFGFRIFDATAWKPLHEDAKSHYHFPCDLAHYPAGERVAMTTLLGVVEIRDMKTGKKLAALGTNALRAAGHVCSPLEWSGDGKVIQVEGLRTAATLAPVHGGPLRSATGVPARGKPVRDEDLVDTRLAPRGDMVAYLDRQGNVRLFSKHGTVPFKVLPAGKGVPAPSDAARPPVQGLSWRPDATALVTWDHTGKLRVWDAAKGELLREMRAGAKPFDAPPDPEVEWARVEWAPDSRSIAFWDGERAELWSLDDGAQKLRAEGAPKLDYPMIAQMSFSPDGSQLAAGQALHDTKSGAVSRKLPAPGVQWLDSGRFLLLGGVQGNEGPVRVLRVIDGAVLALERLGDDASPVLLPRTEDGVFQGPAELAGCAVPAGGAAGAGAARRLAPEPRATLLADFWAGKSIARTCPAL